MQAKKYDGRRMFFYWLIFCCLLAGCNSRGGGRVAVILDNSTSMSEAGASFDDIKQSIFEALSLIPGTYESGLRVFDGGTQASRLVSPYSTDLNPLRQALQAIYPQTGTYIGNTLLQASQDLLDHPSGDHYILMVTDGEGDASDVAAAREVKTRLAGLQGGFKCNFILFSQRSDPWNQTPMGEIAKTLGCNLVVPDGKVTVATLMPALLRVFGLNFYWLWIILSAIAYLILIFLTAYLVFDIQHEQGVLPRLARITALLFIFALVPAVMGAHLIGLFAQFTGIVWAVVLGSCAIVVFAAIGVGKSVAYAKKKGGGDPNDPFA